MTITDTRTRWLALLVLCLGDLMIVLDGTIVNVALPSIRDDLGFSQESLAWVVNAYLLTFGGFLLLGGRLGDLFGHRRLFLGGITLFTLASLACGLATTQGELVAARAVQGVGGAVVSAVALSLIMTLFVEPAERAKAMGVFGFVLSGGGTAGVLLGGVITESLELALDLPGQPPRRDGGLRADAGAAPGRPRPCDGRVDIAGAVAVTASLMLAVYAIVNGNEDGWTPRRRSGCSASRRGSGRVPRLESRLSAPLMPLGIFRNRNVVDRERHRRADGGRDVRVLLLLGAVPPGGARLHPLRSVSRTSPMVIWGSSLFLSDRLVMRFGVKTPLDRRADC